MKSVLIFSIFSIVGAQIYWIERYAGTRSAGYNGDGVQATSAYLYYPWAAKQAPNGNVYIADSYNDRIRIVGPAGIITTPSCLASINNPRGIAVSSGGKIFAGIWAWGIKSCATATSTAVNYAGSGPQTFGGDGGAASSAYFNQIEKIHILEDSSGAVTLWMADSGNHRIRKVSPTGIVTTVAGRGPGGFYGDGLAATNGYFNWPRGIFVASDSTLYISDFYNCRTRKVSPNGILSTFAGSGPCTYAASQNGGQATSAYMHYTNGVGGDSAGNIYIADSWNCMIRVVDPNGIIENFAGYNNGCGWNGESREATLAYLSYPFDVQVSADDSIVYISDRNNHIVRTVMFEPTFSPTRVPTYRPTTYKPTLKPTAIPSQKPTANPSTDPTPNPTVEPTMKPSANPTIKPTTKPSAKPSKHPTNKPTTKPSKIPTASPTDEPTAKPTIEPTLRPTAEPSAFPTYKPSFDPSVKPTARPTTEPSAKPSVEPTPAPTTRPTLSPSVKPTKKPTPDPTVRPTRNPSVSPTVHPTSEPSVKPSRRPTPNPSTKPSKVPTDLPTTDPTVTPSNKPTREPTIVPSTKPTREPTAKPSPRPTTIPSPKPSREPTREPSVKPTLKPTKEPTNKPSVEPTVKPSRKPTHSPSRRPTAEPSQKPSIEPSEVPTTSPTSEPTETPSVFPTTIPTAKPSKEPTSRPSNRPSKVPTAKPSPEPSTHPTPKPSKEPTVAPSAFEENPLYHPPTFIPTVEPSDQPSVKPTPFPSPKPSREPTSNPSRFQENPLYRPPSPKPSREPSVAPTVEPTSYPTVRPSNDPTTRPSNKPSLDPTSTPTAEPTPKPSAKPTPKPSVKPSRIPTSKPSVKPTIRPTPDPTTKPTLEPSVNPSVQPTGRPMPGKPSLGPSLEPTSLTSNICISVMISNKFGVPNSGTLFIYDNTNKYQYVSVTCTVNPQYATYCFDPSIATDGDTVTMVVHGYMMQYPNDVFWQAYVAIGGKTYTGNYMTIMTFIYRHTTNADGSESYSILLSDQSQNVQSNTFKCKNCLVGKTKTTTEVITSVGNGISNPNLFGPSKVQRSLQEIISPSVSSLAVDYGLGGGIWFYSNGLGTYYTITDSTGLNTLYLGTMCLDDNGNRNTNGVCEIDLEPGCYVYRVDGAFDPDMDKISWEFCGAQGGAKTQLNFCIDENMQCKAKTIVTGEEICANLGSDFSSTSVTLAGTFDLGGLNVADISEKDATAIRSALVKEFSDASDSPKGKGVVEIKKLSWVTADPKAFEVKNNGAQASQRKLENKNYMTTLSFEVKILAERFGVKTVDESGINNLHLHMNHYLSRSMSVGVFVSKLLTAAKLVNSKNLETVNFARLGTLKVSHKAIVNNEVSILASAVVIGSAMIGIAFSYMTYKSMKSGVDDAYEQVLAESQHILSRPEN